MILNLGCIVEGHGEVEAVPELVRRFQRVLDPGVGLDILSPIRAGRYKLVKPGEIERLVERLARRLKPPRAILILIDAEDDCPKELAPALVTRAAEARSDITTSVVLAKFEFEAWFLASIESLKGRRGLPQDLTAVPDPEAVRDAKGFLRKHMGGYSPRIDQPALTAVFDMEVARQCSRSFRKCCREIERLLGEASRQPPEMPQHPG